MTDQTVPVPLDLLQKMRGFWAAPDPYTAYDVRSGLPELFDLIPLKVGDALRASQTRELPYQTVLVDREGDVWVSNGSGKFYMAMDGSEDTANLSTVFEPYTLGYLPEESK